MQTILRINHSPTSNILLSALLCVFISSSGWAGAISTGTGEDKVKGSTLFETGKKVLECRNLPDFKGTSVDQNECQTAVQHINNDIGLFCRINRIHKANDELYGPESYYQNNPEQYEKIRDLVRQGRYQDAENTLGNSVQKFGDPWIPSLMGVPAVKISGIKDSYLRMLWRLESFGETIDYLSGKSKKNIPEAKPGVLTKSNPFALPDWLIANLSQMATIPICSNLENAVTSLKCSQQFAHMKANYLETFLGSIDHVHLDKSNHEIFENTKFKVGKNSSHTGHIPMVTAYKKVLEDGKCQKGIMGSAIHIARRLQLEYLSQDHNLFDDLSFGFKELKIEESDKKDCVWASIAVLASAGPALGENLWAMPSNPINNEVRVALTAIAEAIPLLDTMQMRSNKKIYSLPAHFHSSCDFGKTYHFWMPAYLARELAKLNGTTGAAAAGYIAELGYQATSETDGRSPEKIFTVPNCSSTVMEMKMDLSLAAAGAHFGISPDKYKANIDEIFKKTSLVLTPYRELTKDENAKVLYCPFTTRELWEKKFRPYDIFKQAKKLGTP